MKKGFVSIRTLGSTNTRIVDENQLVLARLITGDLAQVPDADFYKLRDIALRNLNYKGLVGLDSRGVRYSWDNIEGHGFAQPDTVVKDVASIFATAFPDGLNGKLIRCSSYGLKHDLETVTGHAGLGSYVSNGYAIIGFVHYLLNVLHVDEKDLGKYIRQQKFNGSPVQLNLDFMLPYSYFKTLGKVQESVRE